MGRVMGSVMGRKLLFLVVLALWLSPRPVPLVAGQPPYPPPWCGDGICNTDSCWDGAIPGRDGCEENIWNCGIDCYNPCDNPTPHWVTDWGTDQFHGGYYYFGSDSLNVPPWTVQYCQYGSTHTVVQHDQQACVSARQPDRTVCFHVEYQSDRKYEPDHYSCCSYFPCGGTGFSCP
jgi:hypothetical protein